MVANVETMFSVREVPWHGLGSVIDHALTSEEALKASGLDWTVEFTPIQTVWKGQVHQIPNKFATVRSTDGHVLGILSDQYSVVQNHEAFEFTDALLQYDVRYETAGSLSTGRRVWMLAKLKPTDLLGDELVPYLVFTNSHDGSSGVRVAITPVRVVCQNTLTLALNTAQRTWSARHIGDMDAKLREARKTLELASAYLDNLPEMAENMVGISLYRDEYEKFLADLFPIAPDAGVRSVNNTTYLRDVLTSRTTVPDLVRFRDTAWGIYNAVADMVTHMEPLRKTEFYRENRFMNVVDGHPITQRAQALLCKIPE